MLHYFKSEEDEYIDELPQNKNEGNRDVDAKVIYQYPKGQFRFPLIPDEELKKKRKSNEERKENRKHSNETMSSRKETRRNTPAVQEARARTSHTPVQKKPSPSSRPFRPTEIPSPIYGFDKHPKRTAPVEFELDTFSSHLEVDPQRLASEREEKNTARVEETPLITPTKRTMAEELLEPQEEKHVEVAPIQEADKVLEVEDELYIEEETSVQQQELVQQFANRELEYQFDVEEEIIEAEAEDVFADHIEQEEVIQEELIDQPEPEREPEASESNRRSHLPFNVLMLKEDKRKLAERSTARNEITRSTEEAAVTVEKAIADDEETSEEEYYVHPSYDLLKPPVFKSVDREWLALQEEQLNETLFHFNVRASVANVTQGPSVTRFEVHPEPGVKVNKITNLADDIKLSLAAKDIRMEAPIPGTHMIGVEVPNESSRPVFISEIIGSDEFAASTSPLTAVLGLDISGKPIVTDLRKMPHGLIAGATGSGKSVCINSILVSLLYKANPNEVKLLLIDPKMVELAPYNQIPHLVSPVITDVKAATAALKWAVEEMERRYELFAHAGVRDITRYNDICEQQKNYSVKLPYIVIIIDELADLMMMSPADVEEAICRIAQKARACGIHLIIATQRPSVDVITGLIKANVPTRIAFSVSSQIDSRTIIDISGAERLLGRGDMLFLENGSSKPVRLQGTYVSDEEIDAIVAHVRREQSPQYLFEQEELLKKAVVTEEEDELFYEACEFIVEQGGASTSSLQRKFKIGYNRAARLIDMMEEQGLISEARGSKPRDVLITESELESMQDE